MKYVCGCFVADDPNFQIGSDWTLNWYREIAKKDEEGFIICPQHGLRRAGWRSLPTVKFKDAPARFDYSLGGFSPLQIEAFLITGIRPVSKKLDVQPAEQDLRDNRDPEQVGKVHVL